LIIRCLEDEVLVYDRRRHRAHCLNRPAADVLTACDGARTPRDIAETLALPIDLVWTALEALSKARLLEVDVARPARRPSRRQALKAAAGVLVPAVLTILVPSSAEAAQSCLDLNKNCKKNNPPPCCPGLTCRDVQIGNATQQRCVP
jgi:hypothetical protein